ncbi:MAG TPA: DNA methyltransferase, partial [Pirellulales bacterium]|nr:DNA methyltransferase [Pirellulales bacterium]
KRILANSRDNPPRLAEHLRLLFQAMATGGYFGADTILHFNGGLFADAEVIELRPNEIKELILVNEYDWGSVEPSIFGTLFERTLDPAKRSQIGAHYTSRADILTLLEPVVMTPLRREWAEVKAKCDALWEKISQQAKGASGKGRRAAAPKESKARKDHDRLLQNFVERLAHVTILDPACGSGNFLYVAINLLLDLEKEVITYAAAHGASLLPQVRPTQLHGIEINPVAQQLAQVVIWIGFLQWKHDNGFPAPRNPVLDPIESIELKDAIIDLTDPEHPTEPGWPNADYIVGNPPFLGGNKIRSELGDRYVEALFGTYDSRVPAFADLCCYWFERAREMIAKNRCQRAGLLATQGIRGAANRRVLERVKESGEIFFAESDRDWILDGAVVHVSMVGFDNGTEREKRLDGGPLDSINANLTSATDVTQACSLKGSMHMCYMGPSKKAPFEIRDEIALRFLRAPNPDGRPNSDVVRPWWNALDLTRRDRSMWIIDFGNEMSGVDAARYESPFEYVSSVVKPARVGRRESRIVEFWWRFGRPRTEFRREMAGRQRYIATPAVAKHRLFVWLPSVVVPDQQLLAFPAGDDYLLGVLHSRAHEVWARAQGTQVRERESGFRYTPTTCFETFPLPEPTAEQRSVIASAAADLDRLRRGWLYPNDWIRHEVLEFPASAIGPWSAYLQETDSQGVGTARFPRLVPIDAECARELAKRTLTNLYNQRPAWLQNAHRDLDDAVLAAYGWPADSSNDQVLEKLLCLNLEREHAN